MKPTYLIILVPILFYVGAAVILDPGTLIARHSDADLTSHLAAISLAKDGDIAYTREDSDRFLREYGYRPSSFRVVQKKMMNSAGEYKSYYAFYQPELFVFALVPFVGALGFRGWLVLHVLLALAIYSIGWFYYRGKDEDALSPALNSVIYFTLIPLPALFLLPSHHFFLIAMISAFLLFGLRGWPVLSAIFLSLVVSSQPWAVIFALFLIGYWQTTKASGQGNPVPRFVLTIIITVFVVWGIERLMYPVASISEPRWVTEGSHLPLQSIWNSLPVAKTYGWVSPRAIHIQDFLFGRNSGFFAYAFPAGALFLSSLWLFRDSLVRVAWLFFLLYLALISVIHPSGWNAVSFANDFWILLAPLPYFLVPLLRPKSIFISIAIPAAFLAGPLLVNPHGAIVNRSDYTYSFPYRFLPVEISLAGRAGITRDPEHRQDFRGGRVYFLNDSFYKENNYFWLRGESTLEFMLELKDHKNVLLELRNGVLENKIKLKFGDLEEEIRLVTAENKLVDLSPYVSRGTRYDGRIYVHGEIRTNSGYVPGLLSRDNPDYRFLSAQLHFNP